MEVEQGASRIAFTRTKPVAGHTTKGIFPVTGTRRELRPALYTLLHECPHFRGLFGVRLELGCDEQAQCCVRRVAAEAPVQHIAPFIASSSDHLILTPFHSVAIIELTGFWIARAAHCRESSMQAKKARSEGTGKPYIMKGVMLMS
jgi:hypothetical protein